MSVAGPSLLDLHKQEYKTKSDALNQLIRGKLIEVEAKRKGLSSDSTLALYLALPLDTYDPF